MSIIFEDLGEADMWKKMLGTMAIGALILGLYGCGTKTAVADGQDGEPVIVRVAFNQSEDHPEYVAMMEFGEKLKEATDGAYEVEIYPNAILGDQGAVTEFVRTGALQMAIVPCSVPEGYDPDYAIVGAPYLYDSTEQLRQAVQGGVFDSLFESTRRFGFEVLTAYTSGERAIYTNKPIYTPEDLKGQKIRVMDSDTYIRLIEMMGGIGIPMSQGEVYTAIQQKVIEGGENSERVYADFKHYEVAPYFSYTRHLIMPDMIVANVDFMDSMSPEHEEIFRKLLKESVDQEFTLMDESVEQGRKEAEAKGAQFAEPDVEVFREHCLPLLEELSGRSEVTREIYEEIQKIKREEN